jgi:hypothetical protein
MSLEWQVELDDDGRVVTGEAAARIEGRYLVVPQADGSLALHALEHLYETPPSPAAPEAAPVSPLDEDAAAAELARWGARALGDLSPGEQAPAVATAAGPLPLVEVLPEDRPQPAPLASDDPAANAAALSSLDSTWRYWLVQNRDAHDLYRHRSGSSRRQAQSGVSPPKSPA